MAHLNAVRFANDVTPIQSRIDYTIGGTTPSFTGTISMALIY